MPSSNPSPNRRGGSGSRGGGGKPAAIASSMGQVDDRTRSTGASSSSLEGPSATMAASSTISTAASPEGRTLGSASRFGHFAKYTKPKIGPAFQCVVPKFVPAGVAGPGAAAGGGGIAEAEDGASGISTVGGKTRGTTGKRRGGGGRGRGRPAGGSSVLSLGAGRSIASGETSAIDLANAAADQCRDGYGAWRAAVAVPRGGLCVHRPQRRAAKDPAPAAGFNPQEDFLTYTRNIFLQTPRPRSSTTVDGIWDEVTARKFRADETVAATTTRTPSGRGNRGKGGNKRKAATMEEGGSLPSSAASSLAKSVPSCEVLNDLCSLRRAPALAGEPPAQDGGDAASGRGPLCGMEDDERALHYLHVTHRGDLDKAKLFLIVNADQGYGVRLRRELRKKRREARGACPDATTFSSESWRWRVHRARPAMLGDFRAGRDPTYPYFDPAPIDVRQLIETSLPWRWRRRSAGGKPVGQPLQGEEERQQPAVVRQRSSSITWTEEEINMAKKIWKSVLAYTNSVLSKMAEGPRERSNTRKPPLSNLLELVEKAHALPTPEEAFGRRDPLARQMSENMNSIMDAIEAGRDSVARVLKCLKDEGEGIKLDDLQKSIDDVERSCPVGLVELETVKRQVREATAWEEELEKSVDHQKTNSDASDSDDVITEKKLTLEQVESLVSKGRNMTLRPQSLARLQNRIERAHILRRRIVVWNEARNQENPQNIKFISSLIKQANKIDLAFPELFTLTGVHRKAEEWLDRAAIASRTTVAFDELAALVVVGEGLPLNVSDVLERLRGRLAQARKWVARLEGLVPRSADRLLWLLRFRSALEDSEGYSRLVSLLSEGLRIPVTMEGAVLLQIEVDARHWTAKARPWIPQDFDTAAKGSTPVKRGKITEVKDHLDKASSLSDRLCFGKAEKSKWVLDGESQLLQMVNMAELWLEKHHNILNYDSRRNGKLCLPMSKLHAIVEEVNQIPLNIGNSSTKVNRMFSQANEWLKKYYHLIKRCGIDYTYIPSGANSVLDESPTPLSIAELSAAISDADSDISVDLEVVVKIREHLERAEIWTSKVNAIAPKKDPRKKGKQEKHSMKEVSDLIDESAAIVVDITDDLERLKLEQSTTLAWRLSAIQTLREIISAFNNFRNERASVDFSTAGSNNPQLKGFPTVANAGPSPLIVSGSMTTRNINSRRRSSSSAGTSGSETPACTENGGKHLFSLLLSFVNGVKSLNSLTPEGSAADELSEVMSWFTKVFKLGSPADLYDRRNFSKLDKLIESGQQLANLDSIDLQDIPEDKNLMCDLRRSWVEVLTDEIEQLLELRSQRTKFVEWCENADAIISSTDKKVSIDTMTDLLGQSAVMPQSSEIVLRVRKRAKESIDWVSSAAGITRTGTKIPLDKAKVMIDIADKLNITCPEHKTLRAALRATRSWLSRVKKCRAANGKAQIAADLVTELINEHQTLLVTADVAFSELKQLMCGYCICRQPYEGFMIACDSCEEWYHGPCVGISQEQSQKFDKYVCVRCSTLRVFKDNATTVAGILQKWTSTKGVAKARSGDAQRYGRKVRSAERDVVKAKTDLDNYDRELKTTLGLASDEQPQVNGGVSALFASSQSQISNLSVFGHNIANGKVEKRVKALRDKIEKAHSTIGNCEKRVEGYKVELEGRKEIEAKEDALAPNLKKWCSMVKQEVISPAMKEKAELSRPNSDGSVSAPMDSAKIYAENLGIVKLPDIDTVLNSFKIFSWCLHSLEKLMRKPRVEEVRVLLAHSDNYFKLPEAKCVRMLRSMSSRAQIWQSKTKKALMPVPNETKPYDLAILRELLVQAKQIPLTMPEETRLWSTIEDGGNRYCTCGGPSDGSFMLGCDNCDRWFHGSCMNIDKATGVALSKWICPTCSKLSPAESVNVQQTHGIPIDEQLLPAHEFNNQQLNQPLLAHPHHDISPNAPNPMTLWPPFGLRSDKEAIDAFGEVGESDIEDFILPIQPIITAKSNHKAYPQDREAASASNLNISSNSQFPLCQPIATLDTGPPIHSKSIPQVSKIAPLTRQAPVHHAHIGAAQAPQAIATKTNHQPNSSSQMPLAQFSTEMAVHHTVSYHRVANMDHYVLSAGTGAALHPVSATPISKSASMKRANGQSYQATTFSQVTPKAP